MFRLHRIHGSTGMFQQHGFLTPLLIYGLFVSPFFCSASGASVVAIDNKIEQAMVSRATRHNNTRQRQGCRLHKKISSWIYVTCMPF